MCQNRLEIAVSVLDDLETQEGKNSSELSRIEEESAKSETLIKSLSEDADAAEKEITETTLNNLSKDIKMNRMLIIIGVIILALLHFFK